VPDFAGRGKRVVGVFVLMVGAGAILDDHALWTGTALMLIGAVEFVRGALEARRPEPAVSHASAAESPESPS